MFATTWEYLGQSVYETSGMIFFIEIRLLLTDDGLRC